MRSEAWKLARGRGGGWGEGGWVGVKAFGGLECIIHQRGCLLRCASETEGTEVQVLFMDAGTFMDSWSQAGWVCPSVANRLGRITHAFTQRRTHTHIHACMHASCMLTYIYAYTYVAPAIRFVCAYSPNGNFSRMWVYARQKSTRDVMFCFQISTCTCAPIFLSHHV